MIQLLNYLDILIIIAILIFVFIGVVIIKGYFQIKEILSKDFVTKEYCNNCRTKDKEHYAEDLKESYNSLVEQIKENKTERSKQIEALTSEYEKLRETHTQQIETVARIETKVDILLEVNNYAKNYHSLDCRDK